MRNIQSIMKAKDANQHKQNPNSWYDKLHLQFKQFKTRK